MIAERRGWLIAAAAAALAALPGLFFPFLSDDWLLVDSVGTGPLPTAPYSYFRPLYMATFWLDWRLWGPSPFFFHLTNLMLIAATAALVVAVARRYTGDPRLALIGGILFALHPYHVENAAWVAVRGDPLFSILLLLAALAYDRWRDGALRPPFAGTTSERLRRPPAPKQGRSARGFQEDLKRRWGGAIAPFGALRIAPFAALALFELAMLAKESAVIFPLVLVVLGLCDPTRRASRSEWERGIAPVAGLAALHILVVRPLALGSGARTLTPGSSLGWLKHVYGFCVATIAPVDAELIAARPGLWGGIAAASVLVLVLLAWTRSRRVPGVVPASLIIFGVLLLPSIVGFQERYLFLAVAASCIALAALLRAIGGRVAVAAGILVAGGWIAGCGSLWSHWYQAAVASRSLVTGLVEASRAPGVRQIVVANMPFRVRGGSVAGDFRSALVLSGGNPVDVHAIAYVSYPDARTDFLDGQGGDPIRRSADYAFLHLRIPSALFCGYVGPGSWKDGAVKSTGGKIFFEEPGRLRIRAEGAPREGRAVYAWVAGGLEPLF